MTLGLASCESRRRTSNGAHARRAIQTCANSNFRDLSIPKAHRLRTAASAHHHVFHSLGSHSKLPRERRKRNHIGFGVFGFTLFDSESRALYPTDHC